MPANHKQPSWSTIDAAKALDYSPLLPAALHEAIKNPSSSSGTSMDIQALMTMME